LFQPENELEKSLLKAADDPAYGPQFYKELSESKLFIIQHEQVPEKDAEGVLEEDMNIQIHNIDIEGKPHIPFFSSLTRLQAVIDGEVGYIALNALDFLNIVKGSDLILNPGSDFGKQFTKEEVIDIIDGTFGDPASTYITEKETTVLVGKPKNYPHELVNALSKYYKTNKEVSSAYLVHFFNPETNDPPHTLVGLQVTGNWDDVISSSVIICKSVEIPDPPVDFMKIDKDELSHFKGVTPFYKKKKFWLI